MLGLYFVDREAQDFIKDLKSRLGDIPIAYFWWHQLPDGGEETLKKLRVSLKNWGFFPIFCHSRERYFLLTCVDFIENPLSGLPFEWKEKYELAFPWQMLITDYKDYCSKAVDKILEEWKSENKEMGRSARTAKPAILFVISNVQEIAKPVGIENWSIYTRLAVVKL